MEREEQKRDRETQTADAAGRKPGFTSTTHGLCLGISPPLSRPSLFLLEASTEQPRGLQSVHSFQLRKGRQPLFPHLSIKTTEAFTPLGSQQNIRYKRALPTADSDGSEVKFKFTLNDTTERMCRCILQSHRREEKGF